mgnify:CR=1 FL=1
MRTANMRTTTFPRSSALASLASTQTNDIRVTPRKTIHYPSAHQRASLILLRLLLERLLSLLGDDDGRFLLGLGFGGIVGGGLVVRVGVGVGGGLREDERRSEVGGNERGERAKERRRRR